MISQANMTVKSIQKCIVLFAVFANVRFSYQQTKDLTFCLKNNTESTLRTFWQDANRRCAKDPYQLIDLYEQLASKSNMDKCGGVLLKQVRKTLLITCADIFEEAIFTSTFNNNFEIERLSKRIYQCDTRISQALFERFIDDIFHFIDTRELAEMMFQNKNFEQMLVSILYLHMKVKYRDDVDPMLLSQITNYLRRIRLNTEFKRLPSKLKRRVEKAIRSLPSGLKNLYFSNKVRLLNTNHWEYLYAPRENGPDDMRRTPLTWIKEKNETDYDGDMSVFISDHGYVGIASDYGGIMRFMYVDKVMQQPYFWLGTDDQEWRWWQIGTEDDYVTFVNTKSKQLLCATLEYDENRRYVKLQASNFEDDEVDQECRWAVVAL